MDNRGPLHSMNTLWPHGVITAELDKFESLLFSFDSQEFQVQSEILASRDQTEQYGDYLLLLKLERSLFLVENLDLTDIVFKNFFRRRFNVPRVAVAHIRMLISMGQTEDAKELLAQHPSDFLEPAHYHYIRSLIYLSESNQSAWFDAIQLALESKPYYRDAVAAIGSLELKMNVNFGALKIVNCYLVEEPLDLLLRHIYHQLLLKNNLTSEASEHEELLLFLKSEPQLIP